MLQDSCPGTCCYFLFFGFWCLRRCLSPCILFWEHLAAWVSQQTGLPLLGVTDTIACATRLGSGPVKKEAPGLEPFPPASLLSLPLLAACPHLLLFAER